MKQLLILLSFTILLCTTTFAESREKQKSAADYSKFYARKVADYSKRIGMSQDELKKQFKKEGKLQEININYFGSIICKSKILTFRKFLKEMPESGKMAFTVTVDKKQEYQKVYFEVLDELYGYYYSCRKRSKLPDDKLDNEIPYFVICSTRGRSEDTVADHQEESQPAESITPLDTTVGSPTEEMGKPIQQKIKKEKKKKDTPEKKIATDTPVEVKKEDAQIYTILILTIAAVIAGILVKKSIKHKK